MIRPLAALMPSLLTVGLLTVGLLTLGPLTVGAANAQAQRSTSRELPAAAGKNLAAPHFTNPWPDPHDLAGIVSESVGFTSSSPFSPDQFLPGPPGSAAGPPATAIATYFRPTGAAPTHKVPAVILLHGSVNMVAVHNATYGPQLAAMGVAVLAIDSYGARSEMGGSLTARAINITETMMVADAYAGLAWLASRPEIDLNRVVLIGFGAGGMASTYALFRQLADRLAPPGLRFAGHAAFYAPCIARFDDTATTGAPILLLNGGGDIVNRGDRCAALSQDLRAGGSQVTSITYPEALPQWDGGPPRRMIGRSLSDCNFRVERNGTIRETDSHLTLSGPLVRKTALALCTFGEGEYPIGRDDAVWRQSNHDLGAFLDRLFSLAG
jgi:dienelactone hydrolase